MNNMRLVFHLWHKDWLRTRWMFLLLCGAIVGCVVSARPELQMPRCQLLQNCDAPILGVMKLMATLILMVFVASVVQDDSPTDSHSFWKSQPVSPGVLLVAKLMYAFVAILVLTIVAQSVSLTLNGFSVLPSLPTIGISVYWVASFVLGAMLLAASGRGTQTFLILAAVFAVIRTLQYSGFFGFILGGAYGGPIEQTISGFRADAWIAVALAVMTWSYLAESVRPRIRARTTLFALLILILAWDSGADRGVRFFTAPTELPNPSTAELSYSVSTLDSTYVLRVEAKAPRAGHRYAIACPFGVLVFSDQHVETGYYSDCRSTYATSHLLEPDSANPNSGIVSAKFVLSRFGHPDPRKTSTLTSLEFDGFLQDLVSEVIATLPAQSVATTTHGSTTITRRAQDEAAFPVITPNRIRQQLEADIQDPSVRKIYLDRNWQDKAMASYGEILPDRAVAISDNIFEFHAVSSDGRQRMRMLTDDYDMLGRNRHANRIRWNTYSLALSGPSVMRYRTYLYPECLPSCGGEQWLNNPLEVIVWKHARYTPVHYAFSIPNR